MLFMNLIYSPLIMHDHNGGGFGFESYTINTPFYIMTRFISFKRHEITTKKTHIHRVKVKTKKSLF